MLTPECVCVGGGSMGSHPSISEGIQKCHGTRNSDKLFLGTKILNLMHTRGHQEVHENVYYEEDT